jgi:hypothetical protein
MKKGRGKLTLPFLNVNDAYMLILFLKPARPRSPGARNIIAGGKGTGAMETLSRLPP